MVLIKCKNDAKNLNSLSFSDLTLWDLLVVLVIVVAVLKVFFCWVEKNDLVFPTKHKHFTATFMPWIFKSGYSLILSSTFSQTCSSVFMCWKEFRSFVNTVFSLSYLKCVCIFSGSSLRNDYTWQRMFL